MLVHKDAGAVETLTVDAMLYLPAILLGVSNDVNADDMSCGLSPAII
jgi:hypothetical protein